jgi:hypothetical protein
MEESQMGHSVVLMNSNNIMSDLETRAIVHLDIHDYNIEVNYTILAWVCTLLKMGCSYSTPYLYFH